MKRSPLVQSYLPLQEKNERSKLLQLKDKYRSFTKSNKEGIPKDLNELKLIKHREHAITFLNQYLNTEKSVSKSKYCKDKHISHNSINKGLKQLGYKIQVKQHTIETSLDQLRLNETNVDKDTRRDTKKSARKTKLITEPNPTISAGLYLTEEEIQKGID